MNGYVDTSAFSMMTLLAVVLSLALYVWLALALGALFRKVGDEPWKGWVPVYNVATLFRHAGLNPWLALLVFVPVVGIVVCLVAVHRVGRGFGYGAGMTVLAGLAPVVWATVIGFGPARWLSDSAHRGAPDAGRSRARGGASSREAAPEAPGVRRSGGTVLPEAEESPGWADAASPVRGFGSLDEGLAPPPVLEGEGVSPRLWAPPAAPSAVPQGLPGPFAAELPPTRPLSLSELLGEREPGEEPARTPPPAVAFDIPDASPRSPSRRSRIPSVLSEPEEPPAPIDAQEGLRAPRPARDPLGTAELSGEVSAIVGSPVAGGPRSASGVMPLWPAGTDDEGWAAAGADSDADEDAFDDRTMLARRKRAAWRLEGDGIPPVAISADVVILGRRPSADPAFPAAQLVEVVDDGRTVSKTHARLERHGEAWLLTDLGSTNGVLAWNEDGDEVEAIAPLPLGAGDDFLLGDERFRLTRG